MNPPTRNSFPVAVCGVLCFCLGVWLRMHAVAVATAGFSNGNSFLPNLNSENPMGNMGKTIADAARANAIYDIALPLLWTGGALLVLAAGVYLLPAWRTRSAGPTSAS